MKNRTVNEWDTGTILIMGDSMSLGLREKKMGSKVDVRGFSGARIKDFYNFNTSIRKTTCSYYIDGWQKRLGRKIL